MNYNTNYRPIARRKPALSEDPAVIAARRRLPSRCSCIHCHLGHAEVHVYFIRDVVEPIVKIGITHVGVIAGKRRGVDDRLKQLEFLACRRLRLLKSVRGSRNTELLLHERFADARVIGEWFTLTDEPAAYIDWFDGWVG